MRYSNVSLPWSGVNGMVVLYQRPLGQRTVVWISKREFCGGRVHIGVINSNCKILRLNSVEVLGKSIR